MTITLTSSSYLTRDLSGFHVSEASSPEDLLRVTKVLNDWKKTINDILIATCYSCDSGIDISETVCSGLKDDIQSKERSIYISQNLEYEIQAVASHNEKTNQIHHILTHPLNIHHRGDTTRQRGAGSSIILHLAKRISSYSPALPLFVKSSSYAVEFYSRCGFTAIHSTSALLIMKLEKV